MKTTKHAYLIGAYHNYEVLKCCISLLDHPENDIFIHVDIKEQSTFPKAELENLARHSSLYFVPSLDVKWAHSSQIALVFNLLENAVQTDQYVYYHFFQGADLPIKTQKEIHAYFDSHAGLEFIDFTFGNQRMADYKANYYHLFVGMKHYRTNRILRYLNHGFAHIQRFLHLKRDKETLYYGSALFSITHAYACDILRRKDVILKRYRFTLACDEVFLQTDIMHSDFREKVAFPHDPHLSNSRYIDWEQHVRNSPHTLTIQDYSKLLSCSKEICFARKFDETIDLEIIQKLFQFLTDKQP